MQSLESWFSLIALFILCFTIIGGAATAFVRLFDINTPIDIGLLHGRAGVVGTLLLILSIVIGNETGQTIKPAIGFLTLTVLGGITLYFIIRRKGILPRSIILIHGALAITAVHTLIFGFNI
ncbi:MAG: hypothetical protein DIZ80_16880 [endosymbiont of Galathealinum brachiosum]|uniref:Uncharacterized protein n=1 Tax=endosymbiont of Galathealinum brachiosum TaxID=2200906 RepID=A0A370D6Q3_9GAMM|nr:MAG: hypothetical protein DIZ80_16880 [endosymbiont of Galathealinum brachiosum]